MLAQNPADRRGNVGRGKRRGRDLIKQRLKEMIIGPVDHGHLHRLVGQALGRLQATKTRPDNYRTGIRAIGILHRRMMGGFHRG